MAGMRPREGEESALVIVGLAAVLLGGVWALRGSGVLGGRVMSDLTTWLVMIGIVLVVVGF